MASILDQAGASLPSAPSTAANRKTSQVVSEFVRCWDEGRRESALDWIARHPELSGERQFVLDLAFEWYCRRVEAGETIDAADFCRQFAAFEPDLRRLLVVQEFLVQNPEWGLAPAAVNWPVPGDEFQGYLLLKELGRGAFSRVFLALELALGPRLVALKVSRDGPAEAQILGRLRHDNIAPVHSVQRHEETGLTLVCMQHCGESTLDHVLDTAFALNRRPTRASVFLDVARGRSPEAEHLESPQPNPRWAGAEYATGVVHLAAQLAEALAYSHGMGVCHGDLKPSNILLDYGGRPLLLDFNLSTDDASTPRRIGGTLPYMAPEQLRAVVACGSTPSPPADPRSDIFSLGCIVYELLTGELPFGFGLVERNSGPLRDSAPELLARQAQGARPLRSLNPHVDGRLARLVESCLAFAPEQRPQTAGELAAALRRCNAAPRRATRWCLAHRVQAALAAVMLVGAIGAAAVWAGTRDPYHVRQIERGRSALVAGDAAAALSHFNAALEAEPASVDALFGRGQAFLHAGKYRFALDDFLAVRAKSPSTVVSALTGYCRCRANDHPNAVLSCMESIYYGGLLPRKVNLPSFSANSSTWNNVKLPDLTTAPGAINQPWFWNFFGYSLERAGNPCAAFECYETALRLEPATFECRFNRGMLSTNHLPTFGKDALQTALMDFEQASRLRPDHPLPHLQLARALVSRDRNDESDRKAAAHVCKALALGLHPSTVQSDVSLTKLPGVQESLARASGTLKFKSVGLIDPPLFSGP